MPFREHVGNCHCTTCHDELIANNGFCRCDQFQVDHPDRYEEAIFEAEQTDADRVGRTNEPFDGYRGECNCPWCESWRAYENVPDYEYNFDTFVERNQIVPVTLERQVQMLCVLCGENHASKQRQDGTPERVYLFCTHCYRLGSIAQCPDCEAYGYSNANVSGRDRPSDVSFPVARQEGWPEQSPCTECLDNHPVQTCEACDRTIVEDLDEDYVISDATSNWYCYGCHTDQLTHCCACDCSIEYDLTFEIVNVGSACFDCRDNEFEYCSECEHYFHDDCACIERMLQRYTHRPSPIFLFDPSLERVDNTVFFGVELELENAGVLSNGRVARNIRDAFVEAILKVDDSIDEDVNLLYFKKDATVRNGFEVVSHPFSWAFLKRHKAAFESIFEAAKSSSMVRQDNCGMHVHISKDRFTRLEVYKLVRFLYGNPFFTERMSSRREDRFRACANVYGESKKDLLKKSRDKRGGGRSCLNLNPVHTMELRMFDSVDDYDVFMRNMEFCESLCRFVKVSSLKHLWPNLYMDYVSKHSKTFPRIDKFLQNTLF